MLIPLMVGVIRTVASMSWSLSHVWGGAGLSVTGVLLVSGGIYLLLIGGLYVLGSEHVRRGVRAQERGMQGLAPESGESSQGNRQRVSLIVPVAGHAPDLDRTLTSLLQQSHPNYEIILVTRDEQDPATSVVREICKGSSHARHVLSGPAQGCGQKNHNLLKGLDAVSGNPDILGFCDANHHAHPLFLHNLVKPIEEGKSPLAGGNHRARVEDFRMGSLGMLLSVMAIHMLQGLPVLTQPWGGATAVSAESFAALDIRGVWAETVVDDYSLGCRFLEHGMRAKPVSEACLLTTVAGQTLAGWAGWLTRQLMYFKFFQPLFWVLAVLVAVILVLPLLFSTCVLLGGAAGWASTDAIVASALFLMVFLLLGTLFRRLVPEEIPLRFWLPAFALMHLVTVWCYGRTWLTNRISWRGISYEVGRKGRVKRILVGHHSESR
jgi:ceramide glucosyltransferase